MLLFKLFLINSLVICSSIKMRKMYFHKCIPRVGLLICLMLSSLPDMQAQKSAVVLLAGYHHTPPVPSPGTGSVTVTLREDTISVKGYFNQLSSPFYGSYIHYGRKGESGNQIIKLEPRLNEDNTGGAFDPENNRRVLTKSQLQALAKGHLYINIYSIKYPRGELRGQIPPLK